ncbi:MAG: DUF2283 domain-containing protein [Palaeococcus sp.]|uniref:DUF2283 domain-containing protein n=1 Tax=Palaeococcus sp. (in: euryarchaeotes) TaxID=2820298 RepID=UPI0025DFB951|nr:DUF2283 domain-containing protein [Palaeococcus sp. (in: euryarchaeotes)]MCD6559666.1 DUF2283 domain-containing protein [Palaeococcus sp. (in: euryarchaeotes)]
MRISYDPKHDVMYIKFSDTKIVETVEVEEGILIDYGEKGEIVGIEIINASLRTHSTSLNEITFRIEEATAH